MFTGKSEFINMLTVSGLMTGFTGYDELYIDIKEPLDQSSAQNVDTFVSNVTTACFNKGPKSYLIIANASNTQQSFLINDNRLGHTDGIIRRYDDKGRLLNERAMGTEHLRHILQPGEFIIVEIVSKG